MKHTEWELQIEIVKQLRKHNWIVLHIPNERNSGVADMQRMKAGGVVKGAPDLICWHIIGGEYWLELKTKTGRRTIEQQCFQSLAAQLNINYLLVRSVDDIQEMIRATQCES